MSIAWKYLDKRRGTVQAVKDYPAMRFIIETTGHEIQEACDGLAHLGGQNLDGMPHASDPKAGETRMACAMDEIDVLKERYRQALEYMDWFVPAWNQLAGDEQFILRTFYEEACGEGSPVDTVCKTCSIERSTAYNRKNKALSHLVTLLFGKG